MYIAYIFDTEVSPGVTPLQLPLQIGQVQLFSYKQPLHSQHYSELVKVTSHVKGMIANLVIIKIEKHL